MVLAHRTLFQNLKLSVFAIFTFKKYEFKFAANIYTYMYIYMYNIYVINSIQYVINSIKFITRAMQKKIDAANAMNATSSSVSTHSQQRITRAMQKKIDDAELKGGATVPSQSTSVSSIVKPKSVKTRKINRNRSKTSNALMQPFLRFDLVWAHVRGYCYWPGVIEDILNNGRYRIHFFGDYSEQCVTRNKIVNYFDGFNQFGYNFNSTGLQKAVKEATFFCSTKNPKMNVLYAKWSIIKIQ